MKQKTGGNFIKRVFFTGGSGKAGRHVMRYLADRGHKVLNADIINMRQDGADFLKVDVTDPGQVFSAMSSHMNRDELRQRQWPLGYDAVVHFAGLKAVRVFVRLFLYFYIVAAASACRRLSPPVHRHV